MILKNMRKVNMLILLVYIQQFNIMKNFLQGHQTIIMNPDEYDNDWFGFIKCKVLAPRGVVSSCTGVEDKV